MFFTQNFNVSLTMLSQDVYISNKGLLSLLQDIAEMHSSSIGYGITDIERTNCSWAILNWKVKYFSRPRYGEALTIKTWARNSCKLYCYRDFEVLNSKGETICIATSKWVLIDVSKGKLSKIDSDFVALYKPEDKSIFNIVEIDKIEDPKHYISSIDYSIRKSEIDVNNHLNNLCYVDIALEAFPGTTNEFNSFNEFEVLYKRQIKIDDEICAYYTVDNNQNYVVIKDKNGDLLHSIIRFY